MNTVLVHSTCFRGCCVFASGMELEKKGWIPCRYSLHVVHYQLACLMLITTADAPVTVVPRSITLPSRPPSSLLLLLIKMREGQTYLRSVCRRFTDCIMHPRTLEKNMKAVSRRVGTVIPQHNIEERGGRAGDSIGLKAGVSSLHAVGSRLATERRRTCKQT